uniref:68MP protein n=1 Tax=Chrysemys picta bellii TaxID=8478 RepID=A0A8C3PAQ9_CHRPI
MLQKCKTWGNMKIYYTTVYQEIWVGLALTTYAYYKLSYGSKLHCFYLRFSCGLTHVHFHHLSQMPPAEG